MNSLKLNKESHKKNLSKCQENHSQLLKVNLLEKSKKITKAKNQVELLKKLKVENLHKKMKPKVNTVTSFSMMKSKAKKVVPKIVQFLLMKTQKVVDLMQANRNK